MPPNVLAYELTRGETQYGLYDVQAYVRVQDDALLVKSLGGDAPATVDIRRNALRRARLGLRLRWHDDWYFRVAGNFAHRPSLRDLWLEYRGWPVRVELGRFPEPFSLGESINSTDTLLVARPSPTFLGPDYGFGAGFNYRGDNWGLSSGIFSRSAGYALSGKYPENALSLRGTWRPLRGELGFLHLGASTSFRETAIGSGVQLFGSGETALLSGLSPRSSLQLQSDRYRLLGGESAVRLGPVLVLAEYIQAHVSGGPSWSGEYVEAGWSLTGERRSYSTRYGTVGGITPNQPVTLGGYGAWELAARWSATDLRSGGGDRGSVISLGLNWYPADSLRISLAAQKMRRSLADGTERDASVAQLQFQLSF
ncbi:OprO/OprP family phosphate-selective porin [Nevskia soli]|uniref:OprO/OprP family phosphate-selective porin n=1 Tax=Nevskia soli TaxID=418856 RepID=UPI00147085A0|nr:porin [Nevskia soli]